MSDRQQLLDWIDAEQDQIFGFYQDFVRKKSPNPPGDTTEAVRHITTFLDSTDAPYRLVDPQPTMANVLGSFEGTAPGRHLVLNGHIDVFPVNEDEAWTQPAWSGAVVDGKVWGRGAADMKCGTSASIFSFAYLARLRDKLKGRLTLTCVSDEETFGPWGARYLMKHHPEVHGDCCLNGEPGSPYTIRFGEKGPLWLKFTVRTKGAHGAYTHASESATKIAARLVGDLESLSAIDATPPGNVGAVLERSAAVIDKAQGEGAAQIVQRVTVNVGVIRGGLKVNMVPSKCVIEADVRFPVGLGKERLMAALAEIVAGYPQATMEEMNFNPPSWCDPEGEMIDIIRANVKTLKGFEPEPIVSLGGTDARLWRYLAIPAYVYGPCPRGRGAADEHVEVEEFLHVVRTHVLSAYDYLTRG